MNYKFAEISNISQVDAAIEGRDEFIRVDKGWYSVFNYVVQSNATFPNVVDETTAILRECRGLIFDANGDVLSRRFQKFFNLGEREEVFIENVDFSRKHTIQLKLDGCLSGNTDVIVMNKIDNHISNITLEELSNRNFYEFLILTYNENQKIYEFCDIINQCHSYGDKEWVSIETEGGSIECTVDHLFLTTEGWVQAQHLNGKTLL